MNTLDLTQVLKQVGNTSDDLLKQELKLLSPDISEGKYHAAFSAYGATKLLDSLDDKTFSGGTAVPNNQLRGIRQTSVVLLRLYTSLVYMRSEHLERGLDTVPDQSELNAFKQLYRSGCQKKVKTRYHSICATHYATVALIFWTRVVFAS